MKREHIRPNISKSSPHSAENDQSTLDRQGRSLSDQNAIHSKKQKSRVFRYICYLFNIRVATNRTDHLDEKSTESLQGERRQTYRKNKKHWLYKAISITAVLFILVDATLIYFSLNYTKAVVTSASMENSLKVNDQVLIEKDRYPKRFSLVVFNPPNEDNEQYVKRVIGLPGDEIVYQEDMLYVNGKKTTEPFLTENKQIFHEKEPNQLYTENFSVETLVGKKKIPLDHYLVLGDNRKNSQDSRFIGLIPKDRVSGIVVLRYYPLQTFERF